MASCVGPADQGKNLVGSFWQPLGVFIDPLCFETLKEKDMLNSIVETVKAGIIADEVLFHLLATTQRKNLASILKKAIKRAIIVKANIVSGDEKEESTYFPGRSPAKYHQRKKA